MAIIKAEITTVKIGPLAIEGLMSENGDFGVAVPQVASLNLVRPNQASRDLKSLLGAGFRFDKWKTPLNSKAVNVIPLDNFQDLIRALDKKGNPAASAFVDALFGLSMHQLFCDAFGLKFETEDRQRWLEARMATRHDFLPLTDQLKAYGFKEPKEYARFVWAFQTKLGIESGTRDSIDIKKQVALQGAQVRLTTLMECGVSPWDALKRI
jgi:hypothetical protein